MTHLLRRTRWGTADVSSLSSEVYAGPSSLSLIGERGAGDTGLGLGAVAVVCAALRCWIVLAGSFPLVSPRRTLRKSLMARSLLIGARFGW